MAVPAYNPVLVTHAAEQVRDRVTNVLAGADYDQVPDQPPTDNASPAHARLQRREQRSRRRQGAALPLPCKPAFDGAAARPSPACPRPARSAAPETSLSDEWSI
ncbi:hypothetical protein XFF6960_730004 [Xanthomonas citri pv. fuscans]|nr:hypothetical protein XFF6960_730004 [Xanthomonas citri pv. fuscans]